MTIYYEIAGSRFDGRLQTTDGTTGAYLPDQADVFGPTLPAQLVNGNWVVTLAGGVTATFTSTANWPSGVTEAGTVTFSNTPNTSRNYAAMELTSRTITLTSHTDMNGTLDMAAGTYTFASSPNTPVAITILDILPLFMWQITQPNRTNTVMFTPTTLSATSGRLRQGLMLGYRSNPPGDAPEVWDAAPSPVDASAPEPAVSVFEPRPFNQPEVAKSDAAAGGSYS